MALVDRAKAVLLQPQQAWPQIAVEPDTVPNILKTYVVPLCIIAGVGGLLGSVLTLISHPMVGLLIAVVGGVFAAVIRFASIYVGAIIIDALATSFGSVKNPVQAMKLSAYSATPGAVASLLSIIPFIGPLFAALISLYGIYLMYLGLPSVMGTPQDKTIAYTAVAALINIAIFTVLYFIVFFIIGVITLSMIGGMSAATYHHY